MNNITKMEIFEWCTQCPYYQECMPYVEWHEEGQSIPYVEQQGPFCLEPSCADGCPEE